MSTRTGGLIVADNVQELSEIDSDFLTSHDAYAAVQARVAEKLGLP